MFCPPSISCAEASLSRSYTYKSNVPTSVVKLAAKECVLGVDEAGRGPVLGPMVYGVAYCSVEYAESISKHGFMDSKVLTHETRECLLKQLCTPGHELYEEMGWAVRVMSARDIGAGMLRELAPYNLNAQAHDATIQLIRDVMAQGVNVRQIYVDTVGIAESYQAKLQREFPQCTVVVTKKADSIYPIVSAASVCAKVTRDASLVVARTEMRGVDVSVRKQHECSAVDCTLEMDHASSLKEGDLAKTEVLSTTREKSDSIDAAGMLQTEDWGSGYPGDARTQEWLKRHKNPIFGWKGDVVRYSWSTAKDLIESVTTKGSKNAEAIEAVWTGVEDSSQSISHYFADKASGYSTAYFGKTVGRKDI